MLIKTTASNCLHREKLLRTPPVVHHLKSFDEDTGKQVYESINKALDLEHQSAVKLKSLGVKVVDGVDKSGFIKVAQPYLEKMSKDLGPHAVKIQQIISAIQ